MLLTLTTALWCAAPAARDAFAGDNFSGIGASPAPAVPGVGRSAGAIADPGTAARRAATMTGGRVLDVQTDFADGRPRYMVKILTGDGRVKVVPIDGAAGRGFAD